MSNKPAKTFREGAVGLSVWERQGSKGTFYDFGISRSYKDREGKSAYTTTFRRENVEAIVRVVHEAATWIEGRNGQSMAAPESTPVPEFESSNGDDAHPTGEAAA